MDDAPLLQRQCRCPISGTFGYAGVYGHRARDQNLGGRQNQIACKLFLTEDGRCRGRRRSAYASRAAFLAEAIVIGGMGRNAREMRALLIAWVNGQVRIMRYDNTFVLRHSAGNICPRVRTNWTADDQSGGQNKSQHFF